MKTKPELILSTFEAGRIDPTELTEIAERAGVSICTVIRAKARLPLRRASLMAIRSVL